MTLRTCLTCFTALLALSLGQAQETKSTKSKKNKDPRRNEFNVAPYFNYNTTIGAGFGLVPLFSFHLDKQDTISPKSFIGLVGYYTTNKSYAVVNFGNFFLKEDTWRLVYAFAFNSYNFQTYYDPPEGDGLFVDYGTKSDFFVLNARRRIYKNIFVGLGYTYQGSKTAFDAPVPDQDTKLNIMRLEVFQDSRDNINYPKNGSLLVLRYHNIPLWLGNDERSNVMIVNANRYIGMVGDRDVLALRFHIKAGLENVKFQQQAVLGGVDLRGYSEGKYRGDGVMDLQGEYRYNFENKLRLSAVGFAGVGTLYGSETEDFNWKLYPSIGAGIRYTALVSNHINVGIDAAVGKDDWGIYFRFKEAF